MERCTCQRKRPCSFFFVGLIILTLSTQNQPLKWKRREISVHNSGCHDRYLQLKVGTTNLLVTRRKEFTPRRIQHKRFLKRMIKHYSNHDASYQMELYVLSCGDVHPNPGHTAKRRQ